MRRGAEAFRRVWTCALAFWLLSAIGSAAVTTTLRPLHFEANLGQAGGSVLFLARGSHYAVTVGESGASSYVLFGAGDKGAIRTEFVGSRRRVAGTGENRLTSVTRHYGGSDPARWLPEIPNYGAVRFPRLYPGIDVLCAGKQGGFEYEFHVAPGADPGRIRFRLLGAGRLTLDSAGNLLIGQGSGALRYRAPVAWQEGAGGRETVAVSYHLAGDTVGFRLAPFDRGRMLFIDPILESAALVGGGGFDAGHAIVYTSWGIFLTGETGSAEFPGAGTTPRIVRDVFVSKLNSEGTGVVFTTILSSSGNDVGRAIAVDSRGNIFVGGSMGGSGFPTTTGTYQGSRDGFVVRLNSQGVLQWGTLIGASGGDEVMGIALDSSGGVHVAGYTASLSGFPTTANAPQQSYRGGLSDAFVARLSAESGSLLRSTLLGGTGGDTANAITVTSDGAACIAGYTDSSDLSVVSAFQQNRRGSSDAIVGCLDASGNSWRFLTYFGGSSTETANSITVDYSGWLYVAGRTNSVDFPLANATQTAVAGDHDAFVSRFNAAGNSLNFSTYLGGSGADEATAVTVLKNIVCVAGFTASGNFPVLNATQSVFQGVFDAFVAKYQFNGSAWERSFVTYLGGPGDDRAAGAAFYRQHLLVTGSTASGFTLQ